jgi:tetratricopeptide (TPR) repeat protein
MNRPWGCTRTIFYSVVLLFIGNIHCTAQWIGDSLNESHIQHGIHAIYNLSFDSAQTEFQIVTKAHPDHPAGYFFLAMVEWWKIVADYDNTSRDARFISMLDKVIDLCDQRLEKNEDDITGLFFKGGALGFQGRLYGNREEWLKAANCGRAALPIIQKAYELEPNNYDVLLGIGIYNYYAAVIPDLYPWVKPLMFFLPKGDKTLGIKQLRDAANKSRYANVEAKYFLLQVLLNFEHQFPEGLQIAQQLHTTFPNNTMFHRYTGRCYASNGKWEKVIETYNEIITRVRSKQIGYDTIAERESQFYLGLAEMETGSYENALPLFYKADELSRTLDHRGPSYFMALTNLRIGMVNDLQGKRELAIVQYNKVLDMKNFGDSHKLAEQYLKTPYTR